MTELPVFITHMEVDHGQHNYLDIGGSRIIQQPDNTNLLLRGHFSIDHQLDCLMIRGYAGTGTAFLLSCTEDEMIMVQNLLETIRS